MPGFDGAVFSLDGRKHYGPGSARERHHHRVDPLSDTTMHEGSKRDIAYQDRTASRTPADLPRATALQANASGA